MLTCPIVNHIHFNTVEFSAMNIHHSYVRKSGFIAGIRYPTYCITCQHLSLAMVDVKMSMSPNTLYCFACDEGFTLIFSGDRSR